MNASNNNNASSNAEESQQVGTTNTAADRAMMPPIGMSRDAASSTTTVTIIWNFVWMAILFSANHGTVVACLALATSQLGTVGAWQSGVLYIAYTGSALLGATYLVKRLGARGGMTLGMGLYCAYVAAFWIASIWHDGERMVALTGAAIGGIGAGLIWTAQGAYFTLAAQEYAAIIQQQHRTTATTTTTGGGVGSDTAATNNNNMADATSSLAGIFAFIYLAEELVLRLLSTVLIRAGLVWSTVFQVYAAVAVISTLLMWTVQNYKDQDGSSAAAPTTSTTTSSSVWYKVTAAAQLLWRDPKMKYMIGLNAVFGFAGAFLNSYVNGVVVRTVLNDPNSSYIGALTAWLSTVAAIMSIVFGRVSQKVGKGPVLILGAFAFMFVALPFILRPELERWGWFLLVLIYTFHGTGRATFEGTLKATFADYFAYEKEGAFANIILQNGLASAIGYVLTFNLLCDKPDGKYCVPFRDDGIYHDVLSFELLVVITAVLAVLGYLAASRINRREQQRAQQEPRDGEEAREDAELLPNQQGGRATASSS